MPSDVLHPRRCWFRHHLTGIGPCQGSLFRCHLIPRQLLKREGLEHLVDDPRTWVPGCGGPMGNAGHHGRLDSRGCNPLRIPRALLPASVEEFAVENGLTWWLAREYGEVAVIEGSWETPGRVSDDFEGAVE